MNRLLIVTLFVSAIMLSSCGDDNEGEILINVPETYVFERNGESTVSFSGQTTRIKMAGELVTALMDNSLTENVLDAMYAHEAGNEDFTDAVLNASDKNLRGKTAASADYFSANQTEAATIKTMFDELIAAQVSEVFPNWGSDATAGNAGAIQQAAGGPVRYVNANGIELNQVFAKSLIGALMMDQMLNNYLSEAVLDAGTDVADNDAGITSEGKSYTSMEHHWDEAYGYAYGTSQDLTNPNATIGQDDDFLNEYIGKVDQDPDFAGIAADIFNAFTYGRAAIVAGEYEIRDQQAAIIKEKISTVIAVRAIYYLQAGKTTLEAANTDYALAFHAISEAYGFIYSLRFTQNPSTGAPYVSAEEVNAMLADLLNDGSNGLWDVTTQTLDELSETIATAFGITVEQAI